MNDIIYRPSKSFKRILVATLLPPPLGVLFLSVYILCTDFLRGFDVNLLSNLIKSSLIFIPFAYILFGIQSILYALMMEFLVNRNIKNNFLVIIISIFLGMFLGMTLGMIGTDSLVIGILIGAAVGLVVGVVVRRMYCRSQDESTRLREI